MEQHRKPSNGLINTENLVNGKVVLVDHWGKDRLFNEWSQENCYLVGEK